MPFKHNEFTLVQGVLMVVKALMRPGYKVFRYSDCKKCPYTLRLNVFDIYTVY